jgi:nitrite reductase (NO-forming)
MWVEFTQAHSEFLAYSTAAIETLLAAAVIFGFARKCTYTGGAIFSLLIWATAEGFGGPYSSSSTDIGSAVMYAVVFLGLLVIDHEAGASAFSVDHWMEQRLSWWHRVAEVRLGGSSGLPTTETVKADSAST